MPKVGLDIGHEHDTWERTGGKGVVVNGKVYEEHTFNKALGDSLRKELELHGIKVISSQSSSLETRTDYYNAKNVDIVVSLHANYNSDSNVKGVCVFGWHNHTDSQNLQNYLLDEFRKAGLDTHGSGDHDSEMGSWTELAITRDTKMTAVLVEHGFMGNPHDFKRIFLETDDYVKKLVPGYMKAICRFFNIRYKGVVKVAEEVNKNEPSVWAKDHWNEAVKNGYFDGTRPQEPTSREETAVVINRLRENFLNLINKRG
jgi:N-acetylmuramoyl-L-alanine amidase